MIGLRQDHAKAVFSNLSESVESAASTMREREAAFAACADLLHTITGSPLGRIAIKEIIEEHLLIIALLKLE